MTPFTDVPLVNELIGVKESFQAPTKMKQIILDREQREKLFRKFLELENDLSYDWFRVYFEQDQANKKQLHQDFTPQSVTEVLAKLGSTDGSYFEPAAGTGGMVIANWWRGCCKQLPWDYKPNDHFYMLEELGDAALPFLLFNLAIRGMNAAVFHGDSLSRECKQIYFVQNDHNDPLRFSSINVMPHSDTVKREFKVSAWTEPEIKHIESVEMSGPVADTLYQMAGGDNNATD